jgi:hypothetical protein
MTGCPASSLDFLGIIRQRWNAPGESDATMLEIDRDTRWHGSSAHLIEIAVCRPDNGHAMLILLKTRDPRRRSARRLEISATKL